MTSKRNDVGICLLNQNSFTRSTSSGPYLKAEVTRGQFEKQKSPIVESTLKMCSAQLLNHKKLSSYFKKEKKSSCHNLALMQK